MNLKTLKFFPLRTLVKALHKLLSIPIIVSFSGLKIVFPPDMLDAVIRNIEHVMLDHEYMEYLISDCRTLLDIGAGIGIFTIYMNKLTKLNRVFLIEANPELIPFIDLNLRLNNVDNYTILNKAVCLSSSTHATLYACKDSFASSLILSHVAMHCSHYKELRVPCIDPSILCSLMRRSDTVKIDVEGAELATLRICRDALTSVKNLVVEVHTDIADPHAIASLLESMNFNVVIHTSTESPYQITILAINRRT